MAEEINLDSRLGVPPQVMTRIVGDELVLLDIAKGVYFGLDGVGKHIWESLSDGQSLQQAAAAVAAEYEVDDDRAASDVMEFASDLVGRELLYVE